MKSRPEPENIGHSDLLSPMI